MSHSLYKKIDISHGNTMKGSISLEDDDIQGTCFRIITLAMKFIKSRLVSVKWFQNDQCYEFNLIHILRNMFITNIL